MMESPDKEDSEDRSSISSSDSSIFKVPEIPKIRLRRVRPTSSENPPKSSLENPPNSSSENPPKVPKIKLQRRPGENETEFVVYGNDSSHSNLSIKDTIDLDELDEENIAKLRENFALMCNKINAKRKCKKCNRQLCNNCTCHCLKYYKHFMRKYLTPISSEYQLSENLVKTTFNNIFCKICNFEFKLLPRH
eukprot:TRINITY_DN7903_c0_g1_i3.p1 TRINITY_DN7903_c0_g1~~TRINITY_DN7903_c0_g1_i3.p1  ORF type:complete len:192 (+),score=25.69 TRINITY_DN7903_c0_g1_i3:36-611(+)